MTMSSTPYVPYQAYKSKRHSRVVSIPQAESNDTASAPSQARHSPSNSLDFARKADGEEKTLRAETAVILADVIALPGNNLSLNGVSKRPRPVSAAGTELPQTVLLEVSSGLEYSNISEPISPISPGGKSADSTTPAVSLNGDASEPSSPSSTRSTPVIPNAPLAPAVNGLAPFSSHGTPEAGPSTAKPTFGVRKSSTFRYVPLRPTSNSMPHTSSPLKPTGMHTRMSSAAAPSPPSTSRHFDHLGPSSGGRSAASSHANPGEASPVLASQASQPVSPSLSVPDELMVKPVVQSLHQRSSSMSVAPPRETFVPPQRTSSLSRPPPPTSMSPSPSSSISASPRVQSPIPQTAPSPASTSHSSVSPYKTVYRPGFQPRGRYRPRTDDFLLHRTQAREGGRVERTRLERRFEKLVDLHFSSSSAEGTSVDGKEKPSQTRRASSFFELDITDLRMKSASELWRGVLESRATATNGGKRDIRVAEQRITPWQDDADASTCPLCSASFHPLTNRKHHCRLCGRIICSLPVKRPQRPVPCSLLFVADPKSGRIEEVSEGVDYGVRPRGKADVPGGGGKGTSEGAEEKFLKGVRICKECKPVMLRQQYRQEAKCVPAMIRLYEALVLLESEIEEALPQFQELMLTLSNNVDEAPTKDASAARKQLLQCFADYDAIAKRIRKIPCPGGPGSSQDRVQAAILARANMFLQKNMFPLQSLPKPKKRSASGAGTDGNGNADTRAVEAGQQVIDPDSELALALQPLLEQEALLETFIEEATAHRKFEDAKTLRANLGEIRAEIGRVVAGGRVG